MKYLILTALLPVAGFAMNASQLWGTWKLGVATCTSSGQVLGSSEGRYFTFLPDGTMIRMSVYRECMLYAASNYELTHDQLKMSKFIYKDTCGLGVEERAESVTSVTASSYDRLLLNYNAVKCDSDRGVQQIELIRTSVE